MLTTNEQKRPIFQEVLMALSNPIQSTRYYYKPILGSIKRKFIWSINRKGNTIIISMSDGTTLVLTPDYYWTIKYELSLWPKQYIPYDIDGKVILDIGSGQGETNYLFNIYNAKAVIGIEKNGFSSELHRINAKTNKWNTKLINSPFDITQFDLNGFDLCKIDIEGAESHLLELDRINFDLIVETHSKDITIALMDKFNLHIKSKHPIYEQYIIGNC